jgi:hypothetical protein
MRRTKQSQGQALRPSPLILTGIGVAALMLLVIFTLTTRLIGSDESDSSIATVVADDSRTSMVPSTTIATRDEVISRLHQIFRIRDQAIQTRDSRVLNGIYTVDCPCLKGDQALVRKLKDEGLMWQGVKVSLIIEDAERVNDRLWIVNALVKTSAFEIRRESGETVRIVAAGQERSRFALSRPEGQDAWLLGQASVLDERG